MIRIDSLLVWKMITGDYYRYRSVAAHSAKNAAMPAAVEANYVSDHLNAISYFAIRNS
jgi:hypothetical protein